MNYWLFIFVLLLMGGFYLFLGLFCSKGMETNEDYFLAGRRLGFWRLTFTLVATQIGGGLLTGSSDEAYWSGYYGMLYSVGMCLGFILLGCGFAAKLRNFNISTVPELFEKKFSSTVLKKIASLMMVLAMTGILVGQVIASRKLIFALGIDSNLVLIIFWLFVIAYTVAGGLKAVVLTDIYQVVLIVLIFVGLFLFCIFFRHFHIPSVHEFIGYQKDFHKPNINFTALFLLPMMFSLIEQDLAQRFFATRTAKVAISGALASSLIIISFAVIPVYFGMQAKFMGLPVSSGLSALIIALTHMKVGSIMVVLVVCSILAAIVSTGDSLLCAISSNIAQDFNFSFLKLKGQISLSRWITLIIGIAAILIAYTSDDIFKVLIDSYAVPLSCLFVPIMFCYFVDKPSKYGAVWSVTFGGISFVLFKFLTITITSPIFISIFISLIGYLLGWWIEKNSRN